jgi:hypothetical protein
VLTKEQASVVADQLIAHAESKSSKKALAWLALRAGKPPPGVSAARFRELLDEAERHVGTSWKLLCPLGAAIIILVALYYGHATSVMVGFTPCAVLLLTALRRKLVQSYIRKAASLDA